MIVGRLGAEMQNPSQSEADAALERMVKLIQGHEILRADDPKTTEADTRSKLIDPVFITVLGFNLFGDGLRDALDPRMK